MHGENVLAPWPCCCRFKIT